MQMLSDDDLNLKDMTREELDRAWDLWFDLAQSTNDFDPPYTHGVFVRWGREWDPFAEETESQDPEAQRDLAASRDDITAGRTRPAEDLLAELEADDARQRASGASPHRARRAGARVSRPRR
jgi:hypothetical protein